MTDNLDDTDETPRMTRELSLYLDLVRFLAAVVVALSHISTHRVSGGLLWQFGPYAHEAVTVFFVLSGFVIAYAVDSRERAPWPYVLARAARIYSVALPALLLTILLDRIGTTLNPAHYSAAWGYVDRGPAEILIKGLFFVNEWWTFGPPLGSNVPYWSLGFEVWYYVIFGLALFAPPRWRLPLIGLVLLAVGPAVAVMLPVWLIGVWAWRTGIRRPLGRRPGAVLFAGSLLAWLAYEAWVWRHGRPLLAEGIVPMRAEVLQDYVIGTLFAANLIGFHAIADLFAPLLARLSGAIRWAAGATFSIYLYHFPVLQFISAVSPWPVASPQSRLLVTLTTFATALLLAAITERRKAPWRDGITWLLRRLGAPIPVPVPRPL